MAIMRVPTQTNPSLAGPESDYGSDLDDATLDDLLTQTESQQHTDTRGSIVASIEDAIPNNASLAPERSVRFARTCIQDQHGNLVGEVSPVLKRTYTGPLREPSVEVEYDEQNRIAFSRTFSHLYCSLRLLACLLCDSSG